MFKMPVGFYEKALEIIRRDIFEQGIVPFPEIFQVLMQTGF